MAKIMETKSARILALILALIMVGSILAYAFRGPSKPEERTIKFDMGDSLRDWLRFIPNSTEYILYFNYSTDNRTLLSFIYNMTVYAIKSMDPYAFGIFKPNNIGMFRQMLVGSPGLYLIDLENRKVYFAYKTKEEYYGYNVKIGSFAGRYYAMADEIHPVVYGYPDYVISTLQIIANHGNGSIADKYGNYTSRINGTFNYAIMVVGETAKRTIQSNGTPVADFYFEGYRMNGTMFEKVVGIHFIGNYFFVKSNKTAFYYCRNYNDGFSIAVMDDYNLTKLINTTPEIRSIIIKIGG